MVGFVFGVLTPAREVDRVVVGRLKAACGPAPTTFHKAFDLVPDRAEALDLIASLGIERVLTSGGALTAEAGAEELARLVRQSGGRVAILAGGGVRSHNAAALVARTGVREVHMCVMRARYGRPPSTSRDEIAAILRAFGGAPS